MLRIWSVPVLRTFVPGLMLAFYPTLLSGFHAVQGEPIDTRLNNYILEHGFQWLLGAEHHVSFWGPPVFYPEAGTLAYTDVLLTVGPLYWAWRALGFLPDTAFQLWTLTITCLNFGSAVLLLRHGLQLSPAATCLGATLFSFPSPSGSRSSSTRERPRSGAGFSFRFSWSVLLNRVPRFRVTTSLG